MAQTVTPSENTVTAGQIGKLQELLAARLRKSELRSAAVQKALEDNGDAIADEMVAAVRKRAEATIFLAPRGRSTITVKERHDPDAFYRTREGLYVYDNFRSRVVSKARSIKAEAFTVESAELMRDLTDEEIEGSLPKNHLFGETEVCAIIAGLIAKQASGEEGTLLNNGYANLFYTGSCVVGASWRSGDREWGVGTWGRGDFGWLAGSQVFSPV